jgi:hypothetical protein
MGKRLLAEGEITGRVRGGRLPEKTVWRRIRLASKELKAPTRNGRVDSKG